MPERRRFEVSGLVTLLVLGGIWQLVIGLGLVQFDYLPAPARIVAAFFDELTGGPLLSATVHTVTTALLAWAIAVVAGVTVGVALGQSRAARIVSMTSIDLLRTLPVIAFLPIAALLFGLSTSTEIAVAAWSALWPILVNTIVAVERVHPRLYEVSAVLHLSTSQRIRAVVCPAAAPLILVGMRLGLSLSLIATVAAEMIINPQGLGYQIIQTQQALRPDAMFAYILAVGGIGMLLNSGLLSLGARVAPNLLRSDGALA